MPAQKTASRKGRGKVSRALDLFRVCPYLAESGGDEPGGALYVPPQGGGRIDNPGFYSVLYLSDSAAGTIAEAFGRFPEWSPSILEGVPSLPKSVRALAHYRLINFGNDAPLCNLDDPKQLLALGLRPSDVVSRNYAVTRAWARRIYERRVWAGVQWWSYYDPAWHSFGMWDIKKPGRFAGDSPSVGQSGAPGSEPRHCEARYCLASILSHNSQKYIRDPAISLPCSALRPIPESTYPSEHPDSSHRRVTD